jgi:hypothetical protein
MFTPEGSTAGLPTDSKGTMRGYGPDIALSKDPSGHVPLHQKG